MAGGLITRLSAIFGFEQEALLDFEKGYLKWCIK